MLVLTHGGRQVFGCGGVKSRVSIQNLVETVMNVMGNGNCHDRISNGHQSLGGWAVPARTEGAPPAPRRCSLPGPPGRLHRRSYPSQSGLCSTRSSRSGRAPAARGNVPRAWPSNPSEAGSRLVPRSMCEALARNPTVGRRRVFWLDHRCPSFSRGCARKASTAGLHLACRRRTENSHVPDPRGASPNSHPSVSGSGVGKARLRIASRSCRTGRRAGW
ncbi:hypothetical protein QBC39DRAFT_353612 [Podospora conica]|nr:hypothetical protein QBC39DRAFT_353612 [Schizothecium conicum]